MAQSYQDLIRQLQSQQPRQQTAPQVQPTSAAQAGVTNISYQQAPNVPKAELRGAADLAKQYGNINYDEDSIYNVFRGEVDARHDALQKGYDRSATDYYNRLGYTQQGIQDAMRDERITSGASAGMRSANQMTSAMGLTQQTTQDATELTREQRALIDQRTADEMQARLDAMQTAQERKQFLAQIDAQLHASDTQHNIGQMGAEAQVSAANVAASAQARTADQQYRGTLDNARYNHAGQVYQADQNLRGQNFATIGSAGSYGYSADQNLRGARYTADQNLAGTREQAAAQRDAAATHAAAQVQSSQIGAEANKFASTQSYNAQIAGLDAQQADQLTANMTSSFNTMISNGFSVNDTLQALEHMYEVDDLTEDQVQKIINSNKSVGTPPPRETR